MCFILYTSNFRYSSTLVKTVTTYLYIRAVYSPLGLLSHPDLIYHIYSKVR